MSLINGRIRGVSQQEFEIRTGRDEMDAGGGAIYEVDPAAVAHFKAVLAARPSRRPQAISSRRHGATQPDQEIRRKANELAARARARAIAQTAQLEPELDREKTMEEFTEEQSVRQAHARFTQGESVKALANELGIPWQTLRGKFRQYSLPAGRADVKKRKPVRAASKAKTAVVPVRETAVVEQQPTDLRAQLSVIQELLGLAEAQSVTLRGKISVELHAEVSF